MLSRFLLFHCSICLSLCPCHLNTVALQNFLITSFFPFLKYNISSRVFSFIVCYKSCNKKTVRICLCKTTEDLTEISMGTASIDHFIYVFKFMDSDLYQFFWNFIMNVWIISANFMVLMLLKWSFIYWCIEIQLAYWLSKSYSVVLLLLLYLKH